MKISAITTVSSHWLSVGNTISIPIDNGFWKTFWHWLSRKNLKRIDKHVIDSVDENSFTYKMN